MNARANVEYGDFKLELEGSEEFVIGQLSEWGAKLPQLARVRTPLSSGGGGDAGSVGSDTEAGAPANAEKKTRKSAPRGSGPSCASRIVGLIDEQFFEAPKKSTDVADRLREKATPYEGKHISAALINVVQRGKLRRVMDGGVWTYVNP